MASNLSDGLQPQSDGLHMFSNLRVMASALIERTRWPTPVDSSAEHRDLIRCEATVPTVTSETLPWSHEAKAEAIRR